MSEGAGSRCGRSAVLEHAFRHIVGPQVHRQDSIYRIMVVADRVGTCRGVEIGTDIMIFLEAFVCRSCFSLHSHICSTLRPMFPATDAALHAEVPSQPVTELQQPYANVLPQFALSFTTSSSS